MELTTHLAELLNERRRHRAALQAVERRIAEQLKEGWRARHRSEQEISELTGYLLGDADGDAGQSMGGDLFEQFVTLNAMTGEAPVESVLSFLPIGELFSIGNLFSAPTAEPRIGDEERRAFFERIAEPGLAEFCRQLRRENVEARLFRYRHARRVITGSGAGENSCRFEVWVDYEEIRLTGTRHIPQGNAPKVSGKRGRGAYISSAPFAERRYRPGDLNLLTSALIAGTFLANFRSRQGKV